MGAGVGCDKPGDFNWITEQSNSINITQDNLSDTFTLAWDASESEYGEINYMIDVKHFDYQTSYENVDEISDTTYDIEYQSFIDNVDFLNVNAATIWFTVYAVDGPDTLKVNGSDIKVFINRYDYLSIESEGIPDEFALHENYPNPFNPTTQIRFDLPEMSNVNLTIYNMLGQRVKAFNMESAPAGYHALTWNATNDLGSPVSAGVYLYQLQTKEFVKTKKMVLLK